ncbi:hypothetical protein ROA7450_04045 [Roseovarius albus]|uniref:Uncharacterized protein n=1 Tax=Roseovarius albus TaxID=1247867 RepID=A0A1X7A841_9RHOB|nr:hypothetical protein ROA7450_04045 [Roseovarius albus]
MKHLLGGDLFRDGVSFGHGALLAYPTLMLQLRHIGQLFSNLKIFP